MKVTFKTDHPTGRYRSFYDPFHYIYIDKMKVGKIEHKHPHKVRLMVYKDDIMEDGNPNCNWKWITLKKEFQSLDEAKAWFIENLTLINEKYKLRFDEQTTK